VRLFPYKIPEFVKKLYPRYTWDFYDKKGKVIYLTFDDGPTPEVTDFVLNLLHKHKAQATFFLIGQNAEKYPELVQLILENGHSIGNHTHNHLKGNLTPTESYIENVTKAAKVLPPTYLFRPPYGRITPSQGKKLIENDYQIVLWDVLSGDFDTTLNINKAMSKMKKKIKPGSIVVFHDSLKAKKNLTALLPDFLRYFINKGYEFKSI
jgi:peptidoglycan/xylan/chitin deacetylase (PgdA/CDA1 family)